MGGVIDKEDTMLEYIRKPVGSVPTLGDKEVRRLILRIALGAWIVVLGVMVALVAGRLQNPLLRQLPSGEVTAYYYYWHSRLSIQSKAPNQNSDL